MNDETPLDRPEITPRSASQRNAKADSNHESVGNASVDQDEFDRQLRAWSTRPPRTSAQTAAERLVARLPERRSRLPWRWAVAATLILGIAAWQIGSYRTVIDNSIDTATRNSIDRSTDSARPTDRRAQIERARSAVDADLLIIPLDGKTTLYMTMTAPAVKKGTST